jgi:hypothetical protein
MTFDTKTKGSRFGHFSDDALCLLESSEDYQILPGHNSGFRHIMLLTRRLPVLPNS